MTALVVCQTDEDRSNRQAAGQLLGRLDKNWADSAAAKRAVPGLVARLAAPLPRTGGRNIPRSAGQEALNLLERIEPDWRQSDVVHRAIPGWIAQLGDGRWPYFGGAAEALDRLGRDWPTRPDSAKAVPQLIKQLSSSEAPPRALAIELLGRFGPAAKAAVPALTKLLDDSKLADLAREALKQIEGQ
jgi:hypothetical protein